jgi:hypothetical protein
LGGFVKKILAPKVKNLKDEFEIDALDEAQRIDIKSNFFQHISNRTIQIDNIFK